MTTLTKSHMVVAQNASGRSMNVPVYRLKGNIPGPTIYIQSSIHGAEVQGNVVIYHLIQALQKQVIAGEIILVPNCNPVGTNIKAGEYTLGRFDPVNGTNWNRGYFFDAEKVKDFADTVQPEDNIDEIRQQFRAYWAACIEEKLASPWGLGLAQQLNLKLQRLAVSADAVLDLHNGPVSTRHIYIPEFAKNAARLFNFPHCIFIPNVFAGALDEATFCPWWTLQEHLESRFGRPYHFDVVGFTLEMGSQEVIKFSEGEIDAASILCYLAAKGCLPEGSHQPKEMTRIGVDLSDYKTLYTDWGGMVEYCAKPGEKVKKGQVMARVLNIDELDNEAGSFDITAPCDLIPMLHFPSASVLSGTQLYKVFTQYTEI
ncbi:succinylglutamate desuccinylase/aspartoacylase family protein [Aestuariibacter sp. A3R04]|uniref:succinylglutamate desuccinylase/aspartoacylase domain-containing protein n=1 Tax=Aestuariibacter sp. A3R04 TaxID=2841571 RepID=UPI001C09B2A6|nr:succinylglutamate desuccinylase/aspartoacylase family protein [Aestuariibacter sp. A3R04]MBU3023196.1 succinylglutamate desuccinylase/aspartoacylase family protein [Aestuariibacter sp. A3R04]